MHYISKKKYLITDLEFRYTEARVGILAFCGILAHDRGRREGERRARNATDSRGGRDGSATAGIGIFQTADILLILFVLNKVHIKIWANRQKNGTSTKDY